MILNLLGCLYLKNLMKTRIDKEVLNADKPCDILFFQWLQDGVLLEKIKTNAAKARVHIVNDGFIDIELF